MSRDVNLHNDGSGMNNLEIAQHAQRLKLRNFKYWMRDELIGKSPDNSEMGIVNLDDKTHEGTHHTCYYKNGNVKYFFDSYGAAPPKELIHYLKSPILYSTYMIQGFNQTNCSEWCLFVLNRLNKGEDFIDVILEIIQKHDIY